MISPRRVMEPSQPLGTGCPVSVLPVGHGVHNVAHVPLVVILGLQHLNPLVSNGHLRVGRNRCDTRGVGARIEHEK